MANFKLISLAVLALMVTSATAQNDDEDDNWLLNQRPEHIVETLADEGADAPLYARRSSSQATAPLKSHGVQKVPVVLVAFKDKGFTVADDDADVNAFYQKFCNGTMDGRRYTGHGSYGSVRDYFVEQSDSAFFPEFEIIGPVTLSKGYAYYGANGTTQKDVNYTEFRNEAVKEAVEIYSDWGNFDNDGNGSVDMVFLLYAGLGENSGGDSLCIWPKEHTGSTTINGIRFATSAATCELRPVKDGGTRPDGIGVFVHELSHALGLPDFYDTATGANFGMDLWSVMDYGNYANNGYTPGNYTAYERDFMGWRPLVELTEPQVLTIQCFADGGYGYKIQNDASANEYYIIENRQSRGWDTSVGNIGHGLQVTHVDYQASAWIDNKVNVDAKHQRMTIIAANDKYIGTNATEDMNVWRETLRGQLFPGYDLVYDLTDETSPAAEVYTGGLLHKPLRNITEYRDGTIKVCYCTNGQLEVPDLEDAANIEMDQFDISWSSVDHATRYAYELYKDSVLIRNDIIAETSLHVDGLQPSSALKFRVRAMADIPEDYVDSYWSEYRYFNTLVDLINDIPDSEKIVDVYSSNGMWVSHCHADELNRLYLRQGIYVLRYSNGAARKVVIR